VAPDWLRQAARYLNQPEVVCFGGPPDVPADATWVQRAWLLVRRKAQDVQQVEWLESMNMFVRREAFTAVGGFDESLRTCEDYDLSLRLAKRGRIVADAAINAVHHGEAATLSHFYRKERWRGIGNFHGLRRHGWCWRELPSLMMPPAYLLCLGLTVAAAVAAVGRFGVSPEAWLLGVLAWQLPILLLAWRKSRNSDELRLRAALYLLLNVYFLARAQAMLRLRN
jgi:GT2 family glycosyltransferase